MVELGQWKSKMAIPEISASTRSPAAPPTIFNNRPQNISTSGPSPRVQDASAAVEAYEHYLRLPELTALCTSKSFPDWSGESLVKPALQALEITFRLISISLSDPRPYSDHRQWKRRLESLAGRQIEIISVICTDDCGSSSGVPVADLSVNKGVLSRERSSQEVWRLSGTATTLVSRTSEASLLPRLAAWEKSEGVASKILYQIESQMHRCPFTLGLGEPNLAGKPSLEYDLVVRPADLHSLKKTPLDHHHHHQLKASHENQILFTLHQILEAWLCAAQQLLRRIGERIDKGEFDEAAGDCWLLEQIWKLLSEVEDLHLLMDPDDFLRLKSQLAIRATSSGCEAFCFRSRALLAVTDSSKELKHRVPQILGVEVDPNGGPRVQEAAMRLFHSRRRGEGDNPGRLHLLQAFQAIEAAVKKFFFAYRQLITAVLGSLEANGNRGGLGFESSDSLITQMFTDPPYFPSLDAAKTFLGELWHFEESRSSASNASGDNK